MRMHGVAIVLAVASIVSCDQVSGTAQFSARHGLEACMGQKTDSITYIYDGPAAVCGLVDAMSLRDNGSSAGQSPFVFLRATKPSGEGGIDYEDYVLNRTWVDEGVQAANISELRRNCGIPKDWDAICGPDLDHPVARKPRFCTLMAERKILVLIAHPNGCPI